MIITVKEINGKGVFTELEKWEVKDLNGKPAVMAEEVVSDGRIDITSIESWYNYKSKLGLDYTSVRGEIINSFDNFESLTDNEKMIVCELFAVLDENGNHDTQAIVMHYLSLNMSPDDVNSLVIRNGINHHDRHVESCKERWKNAINVAMVRLKTKDQVDFASFSEKQVTLLKRYGVIGRSFGDDMDGVIDLINSENSFDKIGLAYRGYSGDVERLILELNEILIKGKKVF